MVLLPARYKIWWLVVHMTFLEWLKDELEHTECEMLEVGFEENDTLSDMIGEEK